MKLMYSVLASLMIRWGTFELKNAPQPFAQLKWRPAQSMFAEPFDTTMNCRSLCQCIRLNPTTVELAEHLS